MNRIAHNASNNEPVEAIIDKFTRENCVSDMLRSVCTSKSKGVSNISILRFLMSVVFTGRSIHRNLESGRFVDFAKDTVYRFLSSCSGWFRALPRIASSLIEKFFAPLTDESRNNVLIIDDSAFSRGDQARSNCLPKPMTMPETSTPKGSDSCPWDGVTATPLFRSTAVCSVPAVKVLCFMMPDLLTG